MHFFCRSGVIKYHSRKLTGKQPNAEFDNQPNVEFDNHPIIDWSAELRFFITKEGSGGKRLGK
jgi:hypothetical protein